jgi:hypothetical protein
MRLTFAVLMMAFLKKKYHQQSMIVKENIRTIYWIVCGTPHLHLILIYHLRPALGKNEGAKIVIPGFSEVITDEE